MTNQYGDWRDKTDLDDKAIGFWTRNRTTILTVVAVVVVVGVVWAFFF